MTPYPVSRPDAVGMFAVFVATTDPLILNSTLLPAALTVISKLYHVFAATVIPVSVAVSTPLLRVTAWNRPLLVPWAYRKNAPSALSAVIESMKPARKV